jgi:hypothetical protein
MVDEMENRLGYLKDHTVLLDKPDYERIDKFLEEINGAIIKNS